MKDLEENKELKSEVEKLENNLFTINVTKKSDLTFQSMEERILRLFSQAVLHSMGCKLNKKLLKVTFIGLASVLNAIDHYRINYRGDICYYRGGNIVHMVFSTALIKAIQQHIDSVSFTFFIEFILNFFQKQQITIEVEGKQSVVINWNNFPNPSFLSSLKKPFIPLQNKILRECEETDRTIIDSLSFFISDRHVAKIVRNYILPSQDEIVQFFKL